MTSVLLWDDGIRGYRCYDPSVEALTGRPEPLMSTCHHGSVTSPLIATDPHGHQEFQYYSDWSHGGSWAGYQQNPYSNYLGSTYGSVHKLFPTQPKMYQPRSTYDANHHAISHERTYSSWSLRPAPQPPTTTQRPMATSPSQRSDYSTSSTGASSVFSGMSRASSNSSSARSSYDLCTSSRSSCASSRPLSFNLNVSDTTPSGVSSYTPSSISSCTPSSVSYDTPTSQTGSQRVITANHNMHGPPHPGYVSMIATATGSQFQHCQAQVSNVASFVTLQEGSGSGKVSLWRPNHAPLNPAADVFCPVSQPTKPKTPRSRSTRWPHSDGKSESRNEDRPLLEGLADDDNDGEECLLQASTLRAAELAAMSDCNVSQASHSQIEEKPKVEQLARIPLEDVSEDTDLHLDFIGLSVRTREESLSTDQSPTSSGRFRSVSMQPSSTDDSVASDEFDSGSDMSDVPEIDPRAMLLDDVMHIFKQRYKVVLHSILSAHGIRKCQNGSGGSSSGSSTTGSSTDITSNASSSLSEVSRKHNRGAVEDEEEGNEPNEKRRKTPGSASTCEKADPDRRFACPFFKRRPRKYMTKSGCPGPGWPDVHRMKEHLYRCHMLPLLCNRCGEPFTSDDLLKQHQRAEIPCPTRELGTPEGISLAQKEKLRSRKGMIANAKEADKWGRAYKILFPDDDEAEMPSPYYEYLEDTPRLQDQTSSADLEDVLRYEVPAQVRREIQSELARELQPFEEDFVRRLPDIIQRVVQQLVVRDAQHAVAEGGSNLRAADSSENVNAASMPSAQLPSSTISHTHEYTVDPSMTFVPWSDVEFANFGGHVEDAFQLPVEIMPSATTSCWPEFHSNQMPDPQ